MEILPKELRKLNERQARSDAMNRFVFECDDRIKDLEAEILVYKGGAVLLVLIAITAIFKLN